MDHDQNFKNLALDYPRYLDCHFIAVELNAMPYRRWRDSTNCPSLRGFVTTKGASEPGRYHDTSESSALQCGRPPSGSAASSSGQEVRR